MMMSPLWDRYDRWSSVCTLPSAQRLRFSLPSRTGTQIGSTARHTTMSMVIKIAHAHWKRTTCNNLNPHVWRANKLSERVASKASRFVLQNVVHPPQQCRSAMIFDCNIDHSKSRIQTGFSIRCDHIENAHFYVRCIFCRQYLVNCMLFAYNFRTCNAKWIDLICARWRHVFIEHVNDMRERKIWCKRQRRYIESNEHQLRR